jgi:hypothetical protein
MPDEDCHPEEEFYSLTALGAPRIELEACSFTHDPRLGKHFEDGFPGFMSNTSSAGSGRGLVGSGKSSLRASGVAK